MKQSILITGLFTFILASTLCNAQDSYLVTSAGEKISGAKVEYWFDYPLMQPENMDKISKCVILYYKTGERREEPKQYNAKQVKEYVSAGTRYFVKPHYETGEKGVYVPMKVLACDGNTSLLQLSIENKVQMVGETYKWMIYTDKKLVAILDKKNTQELLNKHFSCERIKNFLAANGDKSYRRLLDLNEQGDRCCPE